MKTENEQAIGGGAYYAMPTFRERAWRWLGFRHARAPRPEEDESEPGYAPSWFVVETFAHLDWKDRLRVLLTGNLMVQSAVKTDVMISRSKSTSDIAILPSGRLRQ